MIDVARWNQTFFDYFRESGRAYNDAIKYGIKILPTEEQSAPYFAVIGIHHLTGAENAGNHHVYCDVLDDKNQRLQNIIVGIYQHNVGQFFARIDKPKNEPGCNHVLHSNVTNNSVFVSEAGYQSERVDGLSSNHADEESGNTRGHHSFYVVFARLSEGHPVTPPKEPEPPTTPKLTDLDEALLAIYNLLETVLQNQAAQSLALRKIEKHLSSQVNPMMTRVLVTELQRITEQFEALLND
jgi:hypothetical protein